MEHILEHVINEVTNTINAAEERTYKLCTVTQYIHYIPLLLNDNDMTHTANKM